MRITYNGDEFLVVHDVVTHKLGALSLSRGMIFEPMYERVHMWNAGDAFFVETFRSGEKECFVLRGDRSWKSPIAADVEVHIHGVVGPMFVLKSLPSAHPLFGGWCLFDPERNTYQISGCERVFHWRENIYVGTSLRNGSTIHNAETGEHRYVSQVALESPIDDDRWLVREGGRYGAYSLAANALLIPPVFESLAHVHGDFFFAKWQGKSHVLDLKKGKYHLKIGLGAPPRKPEAAPVVKDAQSEKNLSDETYDFTFDLPHVYPAPP